MSDEAEIKFVIGMLKSLNDKINSSPLVTADDLLKLVADVIQEGGDNIGPTDRDQVLLVAELVVESAKAIAKVCKLVNK